MTPIITQYFKNKILDIRKKDPGYSRFMDQKVTPDVLQFVAESIVQYTENASTAFTAKDIESSDYFIKNVPFVFNKPRPGDKRTDREYDKWPAQIIQALRFARVISSSGKKGPATTYKVTEPEILEYIATKSQNAYAFLVEYVAKVLKDSGFYGKFEKYRNLYVAGKLTEADFQHIKTEFCKFIHAYTNISNSYEPPRIFPKVFNVLAAELRLPGSIGGHMSKFPFLMSDLVYNRVNFRDRTKSKSISRQEWLEQETQETERQNPAYRIALAKKRAKQLHAGSEVRDQWASGEATQVHHIFPANEFPQIADRLENLIRLTPTQHNTKAHPGNNNAVVDKDYQLVCLLEKSYNIENSINKGGFDYSKESFMGVINAGLGIDLPYTSSFEKIRMALKKHYAS